MSSRRVGTPDEDEEEHVSEPSAPGKGNPVHDHYGAALELIRSLRKDGLLEAGAGFSDDVAAETVIAALSGRSAVDSISEAIDALLELPGVEELFVDDAEMGRRLRQAFSNNNG